ncbi:hypothetical protein PMG11_06408 [Penicillium brasilianum]|uniref:Uncharacterized protein n=1 Tax=Penicillium brasilianum TaxID=104259 RepID=A0A0F7TM30_PENBI|nr:hypothetical protein PMG11_06408 [Penicillium brasilianum]
MDWPLLHDLILYAQPLTNSNLSIKMRFSVLVLGLLASGTYAFPRVLEVCRGGNSTCDASAPLGDPTACCIGLSCDSGVCVR